MTDPAVADDDDFGLLVDRVTNAVTGKSVDVVPLESLVEFVDRLIGHQSFADMPRTMRSQALGAVGSHIAIEMWRDAGRGNASVVDRAVEWMSAAESALPERNPDRGQWRPALAIGQLTLYTLGGDPARLADAERTFRSTLSEFGAEAARRTDIATSGYYIALQYQQAYRVRDDARLLYMAIDTYRRTVEVAGDGIRAQALARYGDCLHDRYLREAADGDLQAAVDALESALTIFPAGHNDRWRPLAVLATALMDRYARYGAVGDLQRAIDGFTQCRTTTPTDDPSLPDTLSNLGACLMRLYELRRDPLDLSLALQALEEAVARTPENDPYLASRLNNLGGGLLHLFGQSTRSQDLQRAIATHRRAVAATADGDEQLGARLTNLGHALAQWHSINQDSAVLDEAIGVLRRAVTVTQRHDPTLASRRRTLASAIAERFDTSGVEQDRREAIDEFRAAGTAALTSAPAEALQVATRWSEWADSRRSWPELAEAAEFGLTATEQLVAAQDARHDKETWLRNGEGLAASAAYALVASNRDNGDRAVAALERGRAVLLADAFASGPTTSAAAQSDTEPGATDDPPLAYLTGTRHGGLALVARPGESVDVIDLPELSDDRLRLRLNSFRGAYQQRYSDPNRWRAALDDLTGWLWDAVMGPLIGRVQGTAHLVLVATGLLGLAPLHAAWTPDPATPTRRRYALDELLLTYTPSAAALRRARLKALTAAPVRRLLAVDDPRPVAAPLLPYSHLEVHAAVKAFPDARVLRHEQATRGAVVAAMAEADVAHLSCHTHTDRSDPLDTGPLTAGYERLRIRDLMDHNIDLRLAVLSSCETSLVADDIPDEVVGLPYGFLQAGTAAVIGSLWSVPAVSTAALMARFYRYWRSPHRHPGEALRQAQRWLRDATYRDLGQVLPQVAEFRDAPVPSWRPYTDSCSWAAMTYTGW